MLQGSQMTQYAGQRVQAAENMKLMNIINTQQPLQARSKWTYASRQRVHIHDQKACISGGMIEETLWEVCALIQTIIYLHMVNRFRNWISPDRFESDNIF